MFTVTGAISDEFKAEVSTYSTPTGMLAYFATQNVGNGWLLCDGRDVPRADYPALFQQLGTLHGAGDGSTTFGLPDGRGRSLIGAGTGAGLSNRDINSINVGEEAHVQTEAEMPAHKHTWDGPANRTGENGTGVANHWRDSGGAGVSADTGLTGGGAAFPVIHPCLIGWMHVKT